MGLVHNTSICWNTEKVDELVISQYPYGTCIFEVSKKSIRILKANEKYIKELGREGMTEEKALELPWITFMDEKGKRQIIEKMNRLMETGEDLVDEAVFSGINSTQKETWLRASMHLLEKQGEFGLVLCVIENITERKILEQKQKEVTAQLWAVMNNIAGGVTVVYLTSNNQVHFLYANDVYYQQIGYTKEDLEKNDFIIFHLVHPDDRELVIETTKKGSIDREPFSLTYRVLRGDGSVIWVECNVSIVHIMGVEEPVQIGVVTDITAQRLAEQKEQEATAQLQAIMQNIKAGVSVATLINRKINYVYVNDEYYRMFGYTKEEFHHQHPNGLADLIHPDDLQNVYGMAETNEKTGETHCIEFRVIKQNGEQIWVRTNNSVCNLVGFEKPLHIAVIYDITSEKEITEAIRIHEEELLLSMEQMGKMICEYDPVKKILTIPKTYASWYGTSQTFENVPYNEQLYQFIHKNFLEGYIDFYEAICRGEKNGSFDCFIKRINNTWHWEHYEFITIFGDDHKPVKAILSVEDTTEQRAVLERFEREQQLRHELIRNSSIYYQLNLSTGVIEEYKSIYMDVASMRTNASINVIMRNEILANVIKEDQDKVSNTILSPALREAYSKGITNVTTEYRRMTPENEICWVRANGNILQHPVTNDIIAFLYISDIDKEKKQQLALEAIVDEEIEATLLLHVKSERAYICKRKQETLPYDIGEEISYLEFCRNYIRVDMIEEDWDSAEEFLSLNCLYINLKRDKVNRFVYRRQEADDSISQKLIRAIFLDNTEEDIVFSVQDVTALYEEEKRQKEELQQAVDMANRANHAKSDFLSRMSHDIRTPMNAILAFSSEEMLQDSSQLQLQEYLMKIHAAGNYLLGIVNDVLDMSKIEQKKVALHPEPYSIDDFVDTIRMVIGEMSKGKEVDFSMSINDILIREVIVDKIRFNQIFINLLSNAVKFTPPGGKVEFIVEPYSRIVSGNKLHLSQKGSEYKTFAVKRFIVRDNGIGMSENFLPHVFECFSQEYRDDVSDKSQGTGLGLSIVYELVQLMNGSITVDSKYGAGTSFIVELPLEIAVDFSEEKETKTNSDYSLQDRRILLCEDNPINTEITQLLLDKQGCITECAVNGREGYEMFCQSEAGYYDAILMDIRMPVMNGIEAVKAIRSLERDDAEKIPIVAMTADAFIEDEENSKEAGMNGYLSKPVVPEALYSMLLNIIK